MSRYRNAPLKYVLFVANLAPTPMLGERATLDEIHERLRGDLPVREDLRDGDRDVATNVVGARFVDARRSRAVSVMATGIAVDTTDYGEFTGFVELLALALAAIAPLAQGRECRRLGLRYVDEIRIPGARPGDIGQWQGWIDDGLLPPVAVRTPEHGARREVAGALEDVRAGGFGVRFAWHTGDGYAVLPDGPLTIDNPCEPGPYFALDTDSYWAAGPADPALTLADPELIERVRSLHEPVQEYFEMSLTDRLRDDVFGGATA